jgi:hypothetical protein
MYSILLFAAMLGSADSQLVKGQTFIPTINYEKQYPVAWGIPAPSAYNLNAAQTKFHSNSSYRSVLIAEEVQLSAWSTDNDGGFTYGIANALGQYMPSGVEALANAKDIQIGFLENIPFSKTYIVVSYYDVLDSNYAYKLYDWNYSSSTLSLLYTYTFLDPEYPNLPFTTWSTMAYNRISMDISLGANKVAFTFANSNNHNMYTVVGKIDSDTILASPFLPRFSGFLGAASIPITLLAPWGMVYNPTTWDPSVFTIDPSTGDLSWLYPDNPIIRLRATPPFGGYIGIYGFVNIYQEWPEVAFSSPTEAPYLDIENLTYAYYNYASQNLYISNEVTFNDLYTYIGTGLLGDYSHNFMTPGFRSDDGVYLAIPLAPLTTTSILRLPNEQVIYKLDCPDVDATTKQWALAFVKELTPSITNNIVLRYAISGTTFSGNVSLTDGFLGNYDISGYNNIFPAISYNPSGSRIKVGWASNAIATAYPMNDYSYIGVEVDAASTSLASTTDYLLIAKSPFLDAGDNPILAFSKHQNNLNYLYNTFADDDVAYSLKHRSHDWTSSGMWKKASTVDVESENGAIKLNPNPFSESLHIIANQKSEASEVHITDMLGRNLFAQSSTILEMNNALDKLAVSLHTGLYLLTVRTANGNMEIFKIQKN